MGKDAMPEREARINTATGATSRSEIAADPIRRRVWAMQLTAAARAYGYRRPHDEEEAA